MILHIPHASTHIPANVRARFNINDAGLERELLVSTDWFTDELFDVDGATRVVHPVSRLVVDPERFADDALEPMASKGRGVIYTRTVEGTRLREDPESMERQRLLDAYYYPHHQLLEEAVTRELNEKGAALIIDCHSYPSFATRADQIEGGFRPQFGIGTDPFHTPADVIRRCANYFTAAGYSVGINTPFSGSIVPLKYCGKAPRVISMMIEVRRDLYMDESKCTKDDYFAEVHHLLSSFLGTLAQPA